MCGKGYATEALQGFLPAMAAHMACTSDFGYIEAETDPDNVGSHRVLENCGFYLFEIRRNDFESPVMGLRDTCIYRRGIN